MFNRHKILRWILLPMFVCGASLGPATPIGAVLARQTETHVGGTQADPTALQAAFDAAAREAGVPERVLLAVSYNLSRWEDHGGAPSFAGGYGLMHLTQLDRAPEIDGKGDGAHHASRPDPNDPSLHTLDRAAGLLGISPEMLKHDPVQN